MSLAVNIQMTVPKSCASTAAGRDSYRSRNRLRTRRRRVASAVDTRVSNWSGCVESELNRYPCFGRCRATEASLGERNSAKILIRELNWHWATDFSFSSHTENGLLNFPGFVHWRLVLLLRFLRGLLSRLPIPRFPFCAFRG